MKRLLIFATIVALLLGACLVVKRYCAPNALLDQRAHGRLQQREAANSAMGRVYGTIDTSDEDYAEVRTAALGELERMGQLSNDVIVLGFISDSKSELALADQCHQVRRDQAALTHCENRLSATIGAVGH
jgi:hypothetical protein